LHTAVLAVVSCRKSISSHIDKLFETPEDETSEEDLSKSEHELRDQAIEVIRFATKIKLNLIA